MKLEESKFELERQKALFEYWKNNEYNDVWLFITLFGLIVLLTIELKDITTKNWEFYVVISAWLILVFYFRQTMNKHAEKQKPIRFKIEELEIKEK